MLTSVTIGVAAFSPAQAADKARWCVPNVVPSSMSGLEDNALILAKTVKEISDCKIQFKIFEAGALVPTWFTVLVAVCRETSFLTPPVGFGLFYLKGAAPSGVTMLDICRGVAPFILIQIFALCIVYTVPSLAAWLPAMAYN